MARSSHNLNVPDNVKTVYRVVSGWFDHVILPLPHCVLMVTHKSRDYVIVLECRNWKTWSAQLVECASDGEFAMNSLYAKRHDLDIGEHKHEAYEEAKIGAMVAASNWMKENTR